MSVLVAIVLVFGGSLGLLGTWNAVRPLIDPTRWYSPSWLPAMVVTELAPFWLVVHAVVVVVGLLLGGWDTAGGRVGTGLLLVSTALLVAVLTRTAVAVRRLRVGIDGPVHPATGVAQLIGRPIPTPPGVIETLGIDWRHGLTLDLTRPDGGPDRMPVAVYVHGGGWTGGDPQRQARDLYHALALDGWTTLAIRYPFTPRVTVEQQISVVRDAVRWARSGLEAHGVRATHVVLIGGSAGGLLATNAALTPDHDGARVDACVGQYGVYDMANRNRTRAPWAMIRNEVMLSTVDEEPLRYRAVSPLDQIHDASPPMLVVHGTHDTLVPVREAVQFVDALRAAGRPVEFVPVLGAQHAWDAVSSVTSRTTAAVVRDWLRRTID